MKKIETIDICGSGTFPKGNPCHVPKSNLGSFTTNPITYNNPSIGTIIGGLNNTVPTSYVPITNPYITQSSTFPTFTPPVFQTPITKPIQSEHISKIDQSKNISSDLIPYFASHSGKVIGWLEHQNKTLNLNFNIAGKDLDMSNKQITDENMLFFCQKMASFTFHFDNLIISNNLMTNLSVQYLFNATLTAPTHRTIKNLDLRNNQIGDVGAELIAAYLKHGYMPATTHVNLADNIITDKGALCFAESLNSSVNKLKVLHLEGNKITATGTGYFLDALKNSTVGNIIIKQYHLSVFGNKENKIAFMKDYLKQAEVKGVDVKNIVVDKSLSSYIKNISSVCKNTIVGFAKCYYVDDVATDYITDKIIAKVSKTLGVLVNFNDVINCYADASDEVMTSSEGVQLIKTDLEIMGQSTFINAIE